MRKLLLIGAGHAHLYVLKQLERSPLKDVEVTLLTPSEYEYHSGMFSGFAEGLYSLDEIRINARILAERAGVKWMEGAAMSIDPERKAVLTEQGKMLDYDAVSFNVGSLTHGTDRPGVLENADTIRPNYRVPEVITDIHNAVRPVVVGGGLEATEMALSLQTRREREGKEPLVWVTEGGLLDQEVPQAGEKVEKLAREKGVKLHLFDGAEAVASKKVVTASNRKIPYDRLLWMTGPRPHQMFSVSLPVDEIGYLLVEETLQVKQYPSIFGIGSCASVRSYPHLSRNGMQAVKQAPVLWENLKGFFGGGEGLLYRPGSSFMTIMSTGDRKAMLFYKDKMFSGRWAWWMKNRINRSFMKQFT